MVTVAPACRNRRQRLPSAASVAEDHDLATSRIKINCMNSPSVLSPLNLGSHRLPGGFWSLTAGLPLAATALTHPGQSSVRTSAGALVTRSLGAYRPVTQIDRTMSGMSAPSDRSPTSSRTARLPVTWIASTTRRTVPTAPAGGSSPWWTRDRPDDAAARPGLPDQPRRAVLEGLDGGRPARPPAPAAHPAGADGPRRPDQPAPHRRPGTRRSTLIVAGIRPTPSSGYGRDAVGCFGGGGLTNEKAYALGKFARVALRTAMIDYNGRFCMSSAATAGNRAFGIDRGLPFPLADIAEADAILLVGSNPADTMPPAMQYFDAGRAARRHAHRRRPAAHRRPPPASACTCSRCPAPTSRWPTACCTSRSRTG